MTNKPAAKPMVKVSKYDLDLLALCIQHRGTKIKETIAETRMAMRKHMEAHGIKPEQRAEIKVAVNGTWISLTGDKWLDELENFIDTIQKFMRETNRDLPHADTPTQAEITTST